MYIFTSHVVFSFAHRGHSLWQKERPCHMIDKLLGGSSGDTAVAEFPFICFCTQLLVTYLLFCYAILSCQFHNDMEVLLLARFRVIDRNTKAVDKR